VLPQIRVIKTRSRWALRERDTEDYLTDIAKIAKIARIAELVVANTFETRNAGEKEKYK
jgi:hypothetical protein